MNVFLVSLKIPYDKTSLPLADVVWLVGASSCSQKVAGSIPGQGTYLSCGFDPGPGTYQRQPMDASLSHQYFPRFPSL